MGRAKIICFDDEQAQKNLRMHMGRLETGPSPLSVRLKVFPGPLSIRLEIHLSPLLIFKSTKIATLAESRGLYSDSESDPSATQKRILRADLKRSQIEPNISIRIDITFLFLRSNVGLKTSRAVSYNVVLSHGLPLCAEVDDYLFVGIFRQNYCVFLFFVVAAFFFFFSLYSFTSLLLYKMCSTVKHSVCLLVFVQDPLRASAPLGF